MNKPLHHILCLFSLASIFNTLVCMELSNNTYPVKLFQHNHTLKLITQKNLPLQSYDEIIKTHKNISVLRPELPYERFCKCFTVTTTEHLGITGQAPEKLKISHTDDLLEYLDVINNYYEPIKTPEINSLVTYINRQQEITHLAIVTSLDQLNPRDTEQIRVKSKWGQYPDILEHGLFDVPLAYGKYVRFYNLKSCYQQDKKLFLTTLQNAIINCPKIQEELQQGEYILIDLAKGDNISLADDDEIFNNTYTLLQKTTLLLKTCMGLDINTYTETNKHTVLMLATKRNDIEMMKLFLAMGADPQRETISGNTALMIAESAEFHKAVELLKEYGATH